MDGTGSGPYPTAGATLGLATYHQLLSLNRHIVWNDTVIKVSLPKNTITISSMKYEEI